MLDSFPVLVAIGTVLGFLTGLGVGGGSLLILWLTMVLHMEQQAARGMNLLFFLPSAIIACFFRLKQGCIQIRTILPAVISGSISAALFSWISTGIDTGLLKKLFGILLLLTSLREVFYKPKP